MKTKLPLLGTKNTTTQTVLANGILNLGQVYRRNDSRNKCGYRAFELENSSVALQHSGMYKITVTATFSAPVAGDVTLQLYENDEPILGALATETITTADTEFRSVAIDYIILVNTSCVLGNWSTIAKSISVHNVGVGATITNIVFDVVKVA